MNTLELFAGSRSFTKVAQERGHRTFCTDILALPGIDYAVDIFDFDPSVVPFVPDVIWASPDCAAWSNAAGGFHFNSKSLNPKTEKAKMSFKMIDKTMSIIQYFQKRNPSLLFYIENPVGRLQYYLKPVNLFSNDIPRLVTISQCQYGREFQKNTHIWTNDMAWKPKPICKKQMGCHLRNLKNVSDNKLRAWNYSSDGAVPWANTGYYGRAHIPGLLILEILESAEKQLCINTPSV